MKKFLLTFLIAAFSSLGLFAQSNDCLTATPLSLVNGSACSNGTTAGATSSLTLYSTCNVTSLNEVWYTYITDGANNDFTVTSLGITNAQIVVYTGACGGTLEFCDNVTGTTTLSNSWGMAPGTQVWIGIMSNVGIEGNFELCVDSYAPNPSGGNTCAGAIPICDVGTSNVLDMTPLNSSGVTPSCFLGTGNLDIWVEFTVTQGGTIEWSATPSAGDVELDWALFDISGGCPGAEMACNYNYAGGTGSPVGMNDAISCVACPTSALAGACEEFCSEIFLAPGTYTIMIDFYEGTVGTLDFMFTNGTTALIAPLADFTASPTLTCGPDMTVQITDNSIGAGAEWTFGNGDTYSGNNPPDEYYNSPGTYAITVSYPAAQCPSSMTQFVQLLAPLSGNASGVDELCQGTCNGTATLDNITGGDGVYTYEWFDGTMTTTGQTGLTATGLCADTYTVTVSNAACGTTLDIPVVVNFLNPPEDATFNTTPTCDGGTAAITGDTGGTFSFNTPPGDGAVIDPVTGTVTNGTSGATYDILYTTGGPCATTLVVPVTALIIDDPTFTMTATCDGGTAAITGTSGGVFSFDTPPVDAAVIDPVTGVVTGGTAGNTYDILYTTVGSCPSSLVQQVTVLASDDASFALTPTCDGVTANVTGTMGGTFSFSTPPTDGAVIDPLTGTVSGGSSGTSYDVLYTTNGTCFQTSIETEAAIVGDNPTFSMSPNNTCDGATATISGTSGGDFSFNSPPGDGAVIDQATGTITGGTPGATYSVLYTTLGACPASSVVSITVSYCGITLPTAITPNGDGNNDTWEIVDLDLVYPDNVVRIYNRWGNIIFEHDSSTNGPYDTNKWDGTFKGKVLPVGSYYYIVDFNDQDGNSANGAVSILMN